MDDDNLKTEFLPEDEDDGALTEELADKATIDQLFGMYIADATEMFDTLVDVSLEGNPVKTHLELVNAATEIIEMAYVLKAELTDSLANRAEEIKEQGDLLRKQVVEKEN